MEIGKPNISDETKQAFRKRVQGLISRNIADHFSVALKDNGVDEREIQAFLQRPAFASFTRRVIENKEIIAEIDALMLRFLDAPTGLTQNVENDRKATFERSQALRKYLFENQIAAMQPFQKEEKGVVSRLWNQAVRLLSD